MPAELDRQYKKQPYCTEYAPTGASHCRDCKGAISEGALRMGTRFPSRKHEGMQESWFHFNCFWRKPRKTISESRIYSFERLGKTDQNRIRSHLSGKGTKGKGGRRAATTSGVNKRRPRGKAAGAK